METTPAPTASARPSKSPITSKVLALACYIRPALKRFYEASAITFWRIEAREWERLYKEQRGGEAFDSIQRQLAETRAELRKY